MSRLCKQYVHAEHLLPSGSLKFWHVFGRGSLRGQPPIKSLTMRPVSFPGRHTLQVLPHSAVGGIRCPCATPLGEDSGKLLPGLLQALSHASVPFAGFVLYPFISINCTREYNYLSALWVLLANHWTWGWSWRTPDTVTAPHPREIKLPGESLPILLWWTLGQGWEYNSWSESPQT